MQDDREEEIEADSPPAPDAPVPGGNGAEPVPAEPGENPTDTPSEESGSGGESAEGDAEPTADENGDESEADADLPTLPLVSVVEAVLFAAREPLKAAQVARAVGKGTRQEAVKTAIGELNVHYLETGRAFEIAEISGRYQLMSRPEYVSHIMRIYPKREVSEKERTNRLTPAALDTLSIIAYKQPVTRGEIEQIRGVGCGPVLRALIERGSVKVAGKRADLVGQPLMYGTTEAFLAEFGLGSLDELPLRNEFLSMVTEIAQVEPAPAPEEKEETKTDAAEPEAEQESPEERISQ